MPALSTPRETSREAADCFADHYDTFAADAAPFQVVAMFHPSESADDLLAQVKASDPETQALYARAVYLRHALDAAAGRPLTPVASLAAPWRTVARYDLRYAHTHVSLGAFFDVVRGLEDAGSEVRVRLEAWGETTVTRWLVVEARTPCAGPLAERDPVSAYRESDGVDLAAIEAQERGVDGAAA